MPAAENEIAPLRGRMQLTRMIDDAGFNENLATEELDRLSAQLESAREGVITVPYDPPTMTFSQTRLNDSIVFYLNNEEYIKITEEGFFVRGVRTEDRDIYEKFVEWLSRARCNSGMAPIKPKTVPKTRPNKFNRYTALTGGFKHGTE